MRYTVVHETLPTLDPRLKRTVHHDSRSRDFEYDTSRLQIVSAVHQRHAPIFDQGQAGSCTGNAGIGALATDPYWPTIQGLATRPYSLDETGATHLYSDAEVRDGDGPFPPNDNGSSGLSIAKVLKKRGLVAGYRHTFSLDAALKALGQTPILLGVPWLQAMFTPDADGRLHLGGQIAGGHEIEAREIDAVNERVWIDNSWNAKWGVQGRAYLTFGDLGTLLDQQGDVVVLTPLAASKA